MTQEQQNENAGHTNIHPKRDDYNRPVTIHHPSVSSLPETWADPKAIVTVVPEGDVPAELNGVPFSPWVSVPTDIAGWAAVPGQSPHLLEIPLHIPAGKKGGAGVVTIEADGRIWLVSPTNRFGGYRNTLPKGTLEPGLSMQATAIKETWEESGLQVEIIALLGDFERSTSVARYFLARRIGGTPAAMGWESQAVCLVPVCELFGMLNNVYDLEIIRAAGI